jgi:flagella basal body P-ring formation protein FlgA
MNPLQPALAAGLLINGLLAGPLLTGAAAAAATLRSATTLETPLVRLSDLFDDAGPRADRVLGPGPAPGGRIVVEASQLAAIARQFGVDWRPASTADRIVLDRPGRLLPREEVMTTLRAALAGVGAPADGELEVPGFAAPTVPVEGHTEAAIEQVDYDAASGRFTAMLAVICPGMPIQRMRLSGQMQEMVDLPVLAHRLPVGSVLQSGDLQMVRLRAGMLRDETVRHVADAVGLSLRRPTVAGQPLTTADLVRPALVQKGARVAMELYAPGLALIGQGVAQEAGSLGDRIRVVNPTSRAVLEAEVTGPDRVRITPGSAPVQGGGINLVAAR